MKNRVQKWGNSLAIRIPKSFAAELGWDVDAPVEMSLDDGTLVVKTDRRRIWDLESLLGGVTSENVHSAWEEEEGTVADAQPGADEDVG